MALGFLPPEPKDYPIFPLKGMRRDAPPQYLPKGSFNTVKGFLVEQQGLYRRPGFNPYAQVETTNTQPTTPYKMIDLATLWETDGAMSVVLLTEDLCYKVSRLAGLRELLWLYTTGTVTSSGTTVTGTGMDWSTDGIKVGDYLAFETAGGYTTVSDIATVTGSGAITISDDLGDYTGVNYQIKRSLGSKRPDLADWTVHLNKLLIASYYTPVLEYDPAVDDYLHPYIEAGGQPSTGEFYANAITSFGNRVWVGGLDDGSEGEQQQRIRWSQVTDPDNFSDAWAYIDLPYSSGSIQRLIPMGRILVVYLDDAIYFGTLTNFPKLPVQFSKVETAKTGLIGPRAVCSWKNGHFFVGQDDVYFSHSGGIEPMSMPVLKDTIQQCNEPYRIYVTQDPNNTQICFGFPSTYEYIDKVWFYNYRTKEWSYDEITTEMIASPQITETVTWDDLAGFTWDDIGDTYGSWDSFRDEPSSVSLFLEHEDGLYQLIEDKSIDAWADGDMAIEGVIETGDLNFSAPDELKQFSRLSLRMHSDNTYATTITFKVEVSLDGGDSFRNVGNLVVYAGKEEGYVNFNAVGSIIRLRLTTTDEVKPYWIDSMVMRVGFSGRENSIGSQDSIS